MSAYAAMKKGQILRCGAAFAFLQVWALPGFEIRAGAFIKICYTNRCGAARRPKPSVALCRPVCYTFKKEHGGYG